MVDQQGASRDGEVVVTSTGAGKFQVRARAGSNECLVDEPTSVGGLNSGPKSLRSSQCSARSLYRDDDETLCQPEEFSA